MAFYIIALAVFATVYADSDGTQSQTAQARQFTYSQQYPIDLQYDFSLIDPQLQYPPFTGDPSRIQPQVFVYPGAGAPGQPFLLQPGAPPGNFLIPQPQPGFVLRDAPSRPSVFVSGYPKPAYVPPINKDAEEIPTNPGHLQPISPTGGRPEKLETFDEKPEFVRPTAGEADVLGSVDRTLGTNPSLKPGHRFFILNGQPLFSNYPLPQFADSPYQPSSNRFGPENTEFYGYRHNGPSFLPNGFNREPLDQATPHKIPVNNFFLRNSITGEINGAKPQEFDKGYNDIASPQNIVSLNQPDDNFDVLKNLPSLPYKVENYDQLPLLKTNFDANGFEATDPYQIAKLKPIVVPDDEVFGLRDDKSKESRKNKLPNKVQQPVSTTTTTTTIKTPEAIKPIELAETSPGNKLTQPSISRSQPSALALAGPGGVAAAAPRATALTGDRGLSVSSPQATAIAGPTRDQIKESPTLNSREKQ